MNTNIKCFGKVGNDWWYHSGERNTRNQNITRQQGMAILAAAQDANVSMRTHYHGVSTTFHFDCGPFHFNDGVPVAVFPGAIVPAGRRVVHVQHADGTTETDYDWWARQAELDDYQQTLHEASYRQGV